LAREKMKLRRRFSSHQHLFALGIAMCLTILGTTTAFTQDKIVTKDGRTQDVKILGVAGSSIQVQVGAGSIGIPLATVNSVSMPAPAELNIAKAAFSAKEYQKALTALKPLVDKYKGLPTDTGWAQQATSMLGEIYVALDKLPEAEAAYKEYQRVYPGQGSVQAEVGMARIAASKKDYATAKQKLEPITAQALKQKIPPPALASAYSQAFFLLGQAEEAQQEYPAALENYLRTVTVFYHDKTAASSAQERADALRKDHGVTVP
jgi:tetratricopeptide (TPR) repeat protein